MSHPSHCLAAPAPSFPSPNWTLRLWSPAGVSVLGCPAGLMGAAVLVWVLCCAPGCSWEPLPCSGGSLRERTGGREVTAWAKLLVLLSSSSPYLGPVPSAKHHHRIPLGTPVVLQLLHPQAQPQCHIPASWGHLCHSGLLVPGERLTAQGIQTAGRAGDPLGCTGAAWLWVLPGCFHPSSAPLGCTHHSGGAPSVSQPLGLLWQRGSSPTDANTVSVIPLQMCV